MKTIIIVAVVISTAYAASLNNRIVGGQVATSGQFAYEASLRVDGSHICGCCILNEQWVMTAAHCVDGFDETTMTVVTGTNTLNQGGTIYRVRKYVFHADYSTDGDTAVFDIAVIKLRRNIVFNNKVQKIALNSDPVPAGSDLIISGWGIESYPSDEPSNNLKYLQQKAITTEECQEKFQVLGYPVNDAQLCAFARNGEGACSGDSGSPLVFNGKVAGIASWVEPCGVGYPDVYTKVSDYIDWVDNTINSN